LGFLPDPLVSVHSLGALAEQVDAHNTRLLTKRAHERSSGPPAKLLLDSQTASGPSGASSTGAELAQSAAEAKGSIGVASSSVTDSEPSELQDDGTECRPSQVQHRKSRAGAGHHAQSSAAEGASPANSISSMDSVEQGSDSAEGHADHSNNPTEEAGKAPHRRSRLVALIGRFKRRKLSQTASDLTSSPYSSETDRLEAHSQSPGHSPPENQQHASYSGREHTASASHPAPDQHRSIEENAREAPEAQNSMQRSSSEGADLGHCVQRDHSRGGDAGEAPEPAVVGVDRPEMNSIMRMSLHVLIANKINDLVAQAWLSPCLYYLQPCLCVWRLAHLVSSLCHAFVLLCHLTFACCGVDWLGLVQRMCTCSRQAEFSLLSSSDMPSSKTRTSDSTAAVQFLGMQVVAVPGFKRPNGKPRDFGGQQQESTSNLFDVDKDPNQDRVIAQCDEFVRFSEATVDFLKDHSATPINIGQVSVAALQGRHSYCIFDSHCLIDRWTEGLKVCYGADNLIA